ncbi:MAG: hydantoinase/oxoprolinase family protein [Burkholderiales bacterium]
MTNVAVGIDVGGTFTDFVLAERGRPLILHKEPSTSDDPSLAVERGLLVLRSRSDRFRQDGGLVVHGTTIGLNAILQRKGAAAALVVSRGTRDVLEIARCRMPSSFDFRSGKPEPVIPRDRVFELDARIDAAGDIVSRPSSAAVDALCERLAGTGVEAVAIVFLNAYLDGSLEREVAAMVRQRLPRLLISCSAEIWPEIREYERSLVTVLNAQLHPILDRYFATLAQRMEAAGIEATLQISSSTGGTMSLKTARARPIDTILSGPASGVLAAAHFLERAAVPAAITFDMGGTSADISVVQQGKAEHSTQTHVGDMPIMLPVVGVSSIGAGGGSILAVDAQGVLKVGPASAGARPGPVAYGLGGQAPTVTDCYLVCGILGAEGFLGGRIRLDTAAAERALDGIAGRIGLNGAQAAAVAALRVATARMATELFKLLAQRGLEPQQQVLMPFGGAGPTHANLLAEEAGLAGVLIPPAASTFCALGAILADVRRDYVRGLRRGDGSGGDAALWTAFDDLEAQGRVWLEGEGALVTGSYFEYAADMRYSGQSHHLTIEIPAEVRAGSRRDAVLELFHRRHESLYGFREADTAIEILAVRVTIGGSTQAIDLPGLAPRDSPAGPRSRRPVFLDGRWVPVPVYRREDLGAGDERDGPLLVEQDDTTIWVLPGWRVSADASGCLRLRRVA